MQAKEIRKTYLDGQISKRVCWKLMRERLLPLLECQQILQLQDNCDCIAIREDGIVLELTDGEKMYIDFTQTVSRAEGILSGTEREDWGFNLQMLTPDSVIFDIGANIGRFSLQARWNFPDAEIYAFEPVPTTFHKMQKNFELNGVTDVQIFNVGFYDEAGHSKIYVPPADEAASLRRVTDSFYLQEGNVGQSEVKSGQQEMDCRLETLDGFVKKQGISRLDFIKCDTEGAEKMVFSRGEYVLSKLQPIVYTEMLRKHAARFGYNPNEIIVLFKDNGYGCFCETNGRLVPFVMMDENTQETNFFFLHLEKHHSLLEQFG